MTLDAVPGRVPLGGFVYGRLAFPAGVGPWCRTGKQS
jgi:hypothetical protein